MTRQYTICRNALLVAPRPDHLGIGRLLAPGSRALLCPLDRGTSFDASERLTHRFVPLDGLGILPLLSELFSSVIVPPTLSFPLFSVLVISSSSMPIEQVLRYAVPVDMSSSLEQEDKLYQDDVNAVKKWWTDSRWRYTKRPYIAEDIVAKRGNLKIEYPSNVQAKKLWQIIEGRFKVSPAGSPTNSPNIPPLTAGRAARPALPMAAWSRQCLPKWPNTSIRSTFPGGKAHLLPLPRTSHPQISQTTQWWVVL